MPVVVFMLGKLYGQADFYYNEKNSQFDIILSKSFNNSPVLYGNPGMDITEEIVKGLNEDYAKSKE